MHLSSKGVPRGSKGDSRGFQGGFKYATWVYQMPQNNQNNAYLAD